MASFRKRSKYWEYRISYKDPRTGKPVELTATKSDELCPFKTKKLAKLVAAEVEAALNEGTFGQTDKKIIFKNFAAYWFDIYSSSSKKSSSDVRAGHMLELNKHLGHIQLGQITPRLYQQVINELCKSFSRNYVKGIHSCGRMIFEKAYIDGVTTDNPTLYAKLPKEQITIDQIEGSNDVKAHMEPEELEKLLSTAKTKGLDQDYIIFTTLAITGMRVGELCALMWDRVNYEEEFYFHITKTAYNPNSNMRNTTLLPPKNKTSIRYIDFTESFALLLKEHKRKQNIKKMALRDSYVDGNFIFTNDQGYPFSPHKVRQRMERLIRIAELSPEYSPHSLRKTHATILKVQKLLLKPIFKNHNHTKEKQHKLFKVLLRTLFYKNWAVFGQKHFVNML